MTPATSGEPDEDGAYHCPNHANHAEEVITVEGQLRLAEAACQAVVDAGDDYADTGGGQTHDYREWCEQRTTLHPPPDGKKFSMWENRPIQGECRALDPLRERIAVAAKVPDAVWLGFGSDTAYDVGVAKWALRTSVDAWLEFMGRAVADQPGTQG